MTGNRVSYFTGGSSLRDESEAAKPSKFELDPTPVPDDSLADETLSVLAALPPQQRSEVAERMAKDRARLMASDLVRRALSGPDAPKLKDIKSKVGLDPAQVSRIATGAMDGGPQLATLARIAMALGKRLIVEFK